MLIQIVFLWVHNREVLFLWKSRKTPILHLFRTVLALKLRLCRNIVSSRLERIKIAPVKRRQVQELQGTNASIVIPEIRTHEMARNIKVATKSPV